MPLTPVLGSAQATVPLAAFVQAQPVWQRPAQAPSLGLFLQHLNGPPMGQAERRVGGFGTRPEVCDITCQIVKT